MVVVVPGWVTNSSTQCENMLRNDTTVYCTHQSRGTCNVNVVLKLDVQEDGNVCIDPQVIADCRFSASFLALSLQRHPVKTSQHPFRVRGYNA